MDKLAEKMRVLQKREMDLLLEYKKKEVWYILVCFFNESKYFLKFFFKCEELKMPFDGKINPSDLKYYLNIREKQEFKVNHSKLQEYFPLNVVTDGIFKIYQVNFWSKFFRM